MDKLQFLFTMVLLATVIGGIWIFGLDDNLYDAVNSLKKSSTIHPIEKAEAISDQQQNTIINAISEEKDESLIVHNEHFEEPLLTSQKTEIPHTTVIHSNPKTITEEDKIKSLEKLDFELRGEGIGHQGAIANSKKSLIDFTLNPVPDSKLTKFTIKYGTINYGGFIVNVKDGTIEVSGDKITISLTQDDNVDPIGTLIGTLKSSISDAKQANSIHFEDQKIYLGKGIVAPIHFTFDCTLVYKQ